MLKVKLLNNRTQSYKSPAEMRGFFVSPFSEEQKIILIVDDDMELSDGIRAVLENQGHRVMQARDGQQGKQQFLHGKRSYLSFGQPERNL